MADEKISAMPAATAFNSADLITIVHGGVNQQCTKTQALTRNGGEVLQFISVFGIVGFDINGGVLIRPDSGQNVVLKDDTGSHGISLGSGGSINADCAATTSMFFTNASGCQLALHNTGVASISSAGGGNVVVTYTPVSPTNWLTNPTTMADAIDRIAARVVMGGAGPIA